MLRSRRGSPRSLKSPNQGRLWGGSRVPAPEEGIMQKCETCHRDYGRTHQCPGAPAPVPEPQKRKAKRKKATAKKASRKKATRKKPKRKYSYR